jgi:hypothetical protein
VYAQPRSWETARAWASRAFVAEARELHLLTGIIVLAFLAVVSPPRRIRLARLCLVAGTTVAMWLAQAVFYAGAPPVGRYFYPAVFAAVVVWALVGYTVDRIAPRAGKWAAALIVLLVLVPSVRDSWRTTRHAAEVSAASTRVFQDDLSRLRRTAEAADVHVIVLQPWEPATDLERVLSLARFLRASSQLDIMVLPAPQASDQFSAELGDGLRRWSEHGTDVLSPYRPTARCLSVVFGESRPVCSRSMSAPG